MASATADDGSRIPHPLHGPHRRRLQVLRHLQARQLHQKSSSGTFRAVEAHKRGLLAVDPAYPWHFIWQGTGEHFFFNGTTAYWLVGFRDDHTIQYSLDRLHRLKVNRLRVTIAGREASTLFRRACHDTGTGRLSLQPGRHKAQTILFIPASTIPVSICLTGRSLTACCDSPAIAT